MGNEITVGGYLASKGLSYRRRGDEAILNCPFCQDKERKFAIHLLTGNFNCKHENSCGVKGNFYEFQKNMGDTPSVRNGKKTFINTPSKKTYSKPVKKDLPIKDNVREYLINVRKFTPETIDYFKIGSDGEYVVIPYYRHETLVNIKYRSIIDKKNMRQEKNCEPTLFNRDNITSERLIICEGEYDAMTMHQYGYEAVSVPGGAGNHQWVETEWDYLSTFDSIYLCFDNDAAGYMGAVEVAKKLGEWRCKIVKFPHKDANECLIKGISKAEISLCISNADDIKPETLSTPSYYSERIKQLFFQGAKMGIQTPWEGLTSLIKGWRNSELTVWSGRNGSGKSTILNQVFLDLAGKGIKSCIYSGEMTPERYLRWAIIQHNKTDKPTKEAIEKTIDWMDGKIFILDITSSIYPDKLLSDFEYAARRYDVKHFIIDSLMKIKFGKDDELREQQDFMNLLLEFSHKFNVHIHLVAHPRKSESDDDSPGKVDVKGTSHITDMADNVLILYRVSEAKKAKIRAKGNEAADMILTVKKNREFGNEGSVNMLYDEKSKIFSDERW